MIKHRLNLPKCIVTVWALNKIQPKPLTGFKKRLCKVILTQKKT